MHIIKTTRYTPLQLKEEQLGQLSSAQRMAKALQADNCIGFYAYKDSAAIGFALLREYEKGCFFLWNFLIDCRYQGRGMGKEFLRSLIGLLKSDYSALEISTTYLYGNEVAKRLYESLGFAETDVVFEEGVHEVNMMLSLDQ